MVTWVLILTTLLLLLRIYGFFIFIKLFKKQKDKNKKNKYIFYWALILGFGLGVRSSFFVTILPFFIFAIINYFFSKSLFVKKKFSSKNFFIDALKVLSIAYLLMVLFWPHTHKIYFLMPLKLAIESLSFGFGVPYIMLNGDIYLTQEFPKSYILTNMLFKLPEYIL